jgi:hypothetical protein
MFAAWFRGSTPYKPPSRDAVRLHTVSACDQALSDDCSFYFFVDDVYENAASPARAAAFSCHDAHYAIGRKQKTRSMCRQYLQWLLTSGQFDRTYNLTDLDQEYDWALVHDDIQIWADGLALYFFRTFDPETRNRFKHVVEGHHDPSWSKPYRQYDRTMWYKSETWFAFLQHEHPFCFSESVDFEYTENKPKWYGGFHLKTFLPGDPRTLHLSPIPKQDGKITFYYDQDGMYIQPIKEGLLSVSHDAVDEYDYFICPPTFSMQVDEAALMRAIQACTHPLFVVRLTISVLHEPVSHANLIVIDIPNGTLLRYEPHGATTTAYDYSRLDELLQKFVEKHHQVFHGGYIRPEGFCSADGMQAKAEYAIHTEFGGRPAERDVGWCTVVSLMFLHLKLAYPRLSNKEVERLITSKSAGYLKDAVRSYANYIIMNKYGSS